MWSNQSFFQLLLIFALYFQMYWFCLVHVFALAFFSPVILLKQFICIGLWICLLNAFTILHVSCVLSRLSTRYMTLPITMLYYPEEYNQKNRLLQANNHRIDSSSVFCIISLLIIIYVFTFVYSFNFHHLISNAHRSKLIHLYVLLYLWETFL